MTVDIAKARALVGKLRNCDSIYYESSMTRNYRLEDEVDAAADTIAALLDERDALARDAERYLKIRQARSLLQLYVYDDPEDLYSGGWFCKPTPEEVDAFCDAMKGASDD